ncbi:MULTISPECIES: hypothetical protein [Sphingobium]|uniref:hypothetical protein n=1 Tax=Sphingobium TaxID=165695 RepID=UPI0015EBC53C|nr:MULTISPECIES: hypothetical protein [Sphingobium]MCW2363828.1 hypothetical protein [Sphingobium sp. B10D3B]MCW2402775.1 hypothetical protein [Sphingobium sp. B10D7B]
MIRIDRFTRRRANLTLDRPRSAPVSAADSDVAGPEFQDADLQNAGRDFLFGRRKGNEGAPRCTSRPCDLRLNFGNQLPAEGPTDEAGETAIQALLPELGKLACMYARRDCGCVRNGVVAIKQNDRLQRRAKWCIIL